MTEALSAPRQNPSGNRFSLAEVARHASDDDCWIIVRGKVYDVSGWAREHKGGAVVYAFAGRDATDAFTSFHSPAAWKELALRCIGELDAASKLSDLVHEFRALRTTLQLNGHFKSSKAYYAFKVASNFALLAASIALLVMAGDSLLITTLAAIFLGVFWQQTGWLSHDFCHHQVFTARRWNDAMGYLLGNLMQGFSSDWWKTKHNLHHAAPNELDPGMHAVDPDIDTLPLLAWSADMLKPASGKVRFHLIRWQSILFFPILILARFNWALSSLAHAVRLARSTRRGKVELALIALHYVWHLGVALFFLPVPLAIFYALFSQIVAGALLAIVFVQGHSGREVFRARQDFFSAQVLSTRDIHAGLWNDWFTGGLNYQIEHHLFPTMPRHNLAKVSAPVRELCAKHELMFDVSGMAESTVKVLKCLADIAAQAKAISPEQKVA